MNRPTDNPRSARCDPRAGFTLVELLVTITIIGILAAVVMGALQAARQTARVSKTKATIAKLNSIVMQRYESYHTRRLPITTASQDPKVAAANRVSALYDLMRMEMPDRWSDVARKGTSTSTNPNDWAPSETCLVLSTPPSLLLRNFRAYGSAYTRLTSAPLSLSHDDAMKRLESWGAAECLYLIVMSTPDAADKFRENEIGDVDADGLREFLDGWGRPIRFIRWPAGFLPDTTVSPPEYPADTDLQSLDAGGENVDLAHNPFDPWKTLSANYAIYPLIYSAGPDGIFDINIGRSSTGTYAYSNPDPYTDDGNTPAHLIGRPLDGQTPTGEPANGEPNHFDNIHNQRIEAR